MTLYFSHPSSHKHDTGEGHPECSKRLEVIDKAIDAMTLPALTKTQAITPATESSILLAHDGHYYSHLQEASDQAQQEALYLDPDTRMSADSLQASRYAAGATLLATDRVLQKTAKNAFCATRPPGHHAESKKAMGFCLLNSIAIAAKHAIMHHGLERIAVIDFDVHHGNGTQDIFWPDANCFYGSTHAIDHFPFSGGKDQVTPDHICNAPLFSGDSSVHFKAAMTEKVLPALVDFRPDMIFISAGFDAHRLDPLASLNLEDDDFYWITLKLAEIADHYCHSRIVSTLEGGYNLDVLGQSVATHVKALSEAAT